MRIVCIVASLAPISASTSGWGRGEQHAVLVGGAAHDLRPHQVTAVGERGVGVEQLERGDRDHVLADAGLRQLTGEDPGAPL